MTPRSRCGLLAIVFLTLGILCLWTGLASGEERPRRRAFVAAIVANAALGAVDVAQSVPCLRAGATCREANPLYARTSPAGFVTIKAAGVGGVSTIAWRLRKTRPKLAWLVLGSMVAVQSAVVVHNARTLSRR